MSTLKMWSYAELLILLFGETGGFVILVIALYLLVQKYIFTNICSVCAYLTNKTKEWNVTI